MHFGAKQRVYTDELTKESENVRDGDLSGSGRKVAHKNETKSGDERPFNKGLW